MEGFDEEWTYVDADYNLITYTNLDPGKYLLMIKGSNNDGVWNETSTSLQLVILPPWWKSWWFQGLLYFSIAGLLLLFYFLREAFYRNQRSQSGKELQTQQSFAL